MRRTTLMISATIACLASTGQGAWADSVVAPFKCWITNGALHAETTPLRLHKIVGKQEHKSVRLCSRSDRKQCRTLDVYRFKLECGGGQASWQDVVARLLAPRVKNVSSRRGTLVFELNARTFAELNPLCAGARTQPALAEGAARHWQLDATCREFGFLPTNRIVTRRYFAPLAELGARVLPATAPGSAKPPTPRRKPSPEPAIKAPKLVAAAATPPKIRPEPAENAHQPAPDRSSAGAPPQAWTANHASSPSSPRPQPVTAVVDMVEAGAFPPRQSPFAGPAVAENAARTEPVILDSWNTLVTVIRAGTGGTIAPEYRRTAQHSMIATMLGLALLTSLFSGIGWLAGRRLSRPGNVRHVDPYQVILRRDVVDLAKPDAQMCGELCRSAQGLVGQIHAGVTELKNVAPLRRVLLREVRNMEKFLTATMSNEPDDPAEWRKMRLRLQRVVTDLMRLKDITDGARRSLTSVVVTKGLPRDKYEAFEVIGANPEASERILKRLVDALRATWHPDLANNEEDRMAREDRIKQINVAWDLIQEKRVEA